MLQCLGCAKEGLTESFTYTGSYKWFCFECWVMGKVYD